jgi:sugar-specific transcriptional regulator TrmB
MKNIIQNLQALNFSQYESKAYLALLHQPHVTGYELAKNSGIPASKIYQVLNKLIEKEIVLVIDEEPVKYVPIPPDEVLSKFRSDYKHNLDILTKKLNEIYTESPQIEQYIWNINGRDAILRRVTEFIGSADTEIHLSVWDEELIEIKECLSTANQRGVKLHIVHYGESVLQFGKEYRHGREHQIRQQRGARRIALQVDEQRIILAHFMEEGSSHAVWTNNRNMVLLAKDYIIHDIYTIRIAQKFGREADEIFRN